jgi:ferredoxin
VRKICAVGCIGCGICVKLTPEGGFELKDNLARVNYQKIRECKDWYKAIEKCPTQCIVEVR